MTCCPDFETKEATAQAGDVVFFLRHDNGDAPPALHNFFIGNDLESPPLAASPTLAQGESIVFAVSGIEAGTYTYSRTVAAPDGTLHSQAGMTGTLTVTE
jgi:plastocyanin